MKQKLPHWFAIVPLLLLVAGIAILETDRANIIKNAELNSFRHIGQFSASYSLADTVRSVASTSPDHVPFYFLTLNLWSKLVGTSIEMLRTLTIYFGLLGIVLGYQFACRLLSRRVGFFVALMMSASAYSIYFMHEIRMYALLPPLIIGLYATYWHIVSSRKPLSVFAWVILYAFSTAILYTHHVGIFALGAIGIYHFLFVKKDRRWLTVAGVMILVGLSFSLWLPVFMRGAERKILGDPRDNLAMGELIVKIIELYTNQFIALSVIWIIAIVAIIRQRTKPTLFLLTIALVPLLGIFVVNFLFNLITVGGLRYTIILLPSFALLFGYGMHRLVSWQGSMLALLLVYIIAGVWFNQTAGFRVYTTQWARAEQYPPIYLITEYVDNNQYMPNPEPLISMTDVEAPRSFVRYYSLTIDNKFLHINPDNILTSVRDVLTETLVDLIDFENEPAFWLAYRPEFDLKSHTIYQTILTEYHDSCGIRESNDNMIIEYYLQKGVPCEVIDATFEVQYEHDDILLTHVYSVMDNQILTLHSIWNRANTESAFPYALSFQIFDTNGEKVAQQDYISPFEPIDKKEFDISVLDAGIYTLTLTLYDAETGFVNQGLVGYSGDLVNNVILMEFTVK